MNQDAPREREREGESERGLLALERREVQLDLARQGGSTDY